MDQFGDLCFRQGRLQVPRCHRFFHDRIEADDLVRRKHIFREEFIAQALSEAKVVTTKVKLKKYAYEAYPSWSAAHPDKACPGNITELNEYMNGNDSNDSWGRPIKLMCGASLPAGAKGIALLSSGEDGKEGTEDDLKSWE